MKDNISDITIYIPKRKRPENPPEGPKETKPTNLEDKVFYGTMYGMFVGTVIGLFGMWGYSCYNRYQRDEMQLEEQREKLREDIQTFDSKKRAYESELEHKVRE